jgi:hypothetical protein
MDYYHKKTNMSLNPIELININDRYRTVDAEGDLITINNIHPIKYNDIYPILVPINWQSYTHVTQQEYDKKININVKKMLTSVKNIIIAGGSAALPLCSNGWNKCVDTDIFIYGIHDDNTFWKKVVEIMKTLLLIFNNCINVILKIKQGVFVMKYKTENKWEEYQIILRKYKTISSILHGFDLPSSCIGYDGVTTYTTSIGAYAISCQLNIVITKYRSPSYEYRLKKYFDRNYGLCLIDMPKHAINDSIWEFRYISLTINNKISPLIVEGDFCVKISNSGYTYSTIRNIKKCNHFIRYVQHFEQIGFTIKHNSFNLKYILNSTVSDIIKEHRVISYQKFAKALINTPLNKIYKYDLPKSVINEIIDILYTKENPIIYIIALLEEQINFHGNYIPNWLIEGDPKKQFTCSINPIIEDSSIWYTNDHL